MTPYPQISLAGLPDGTQLQMDFLDTTWFKSRGRTRPFPTPEHLLSRYPQPHTHSPARFADLGLIVQWGPRVTTTEAINLWAVRKVFQEAVPVPEVYGWRVLESEGNNRYVFIYMQLVQGPTLAQRWPELSWADKQAICGDLRAMLTNLRSLRDSDTQQFIGKRIQ